MQTQNLEDKTDQTNLQQLPGKLDVLLGINVRFLRRLRIQTGLNGI